MRPPLSATGRRRRRRINDDVSVSEPDEEESEWQPHGDLLKEQENDFIVPSTEDEDDEPEAEDDLAWGSGASVSRED